MKDIDESLFKIKFLGRGFQIGPPPQDIKLFRVLSVASVGLTRMTRLNFWT